ncbi:phosphoribosyltransferase [Sulfuriflexus sp.]|uniref:phosphoribosyltransferase n=1 Tax=Sulfuriflexus sp. TaxID=2015443 RepID=UPI0028CC3261|nr:phosphoribosyltransferase [Sulfuriflexus sp.]MDT8404735.1 phosphoribosyltransferase [Sulfuriflexus sp.]
MKLPIRNRQLAGQALAQELASRIDREDLLILALPRGGVPVAYELAVKFDVPLDLMLVRKLGTPGYVELAMGAIASGGVRVLNEDIVSSLGITSEVIDKVSREEEKELARREQVYRGKRPRPKIENQQVLLVDDGIATGATMRAAIAALRQQKPRRIIIAVPVAPPDTIRLLRNEADEVVCLATPEPFMAIGNWYADFNQVTDEEVRQLLTDRWESTSQ